HGRMPKVTGLTLAAAETLIAKAGIKYSRVQVKYSSTAPKGIRFGQISAQSVPSGANLVNSIAKLPTITLTVYDGSSKSACGTAELKALKGSSIGTADQLLRKLGCKVTYDFTNNGSTAVVGAGKNTGGKNVREPATCASSP